MLLCVVGLATVLAGFHDRTQGGWGWFVAAGSVTTATGAIILMVWPAADLSVGVAMEAAEFVLQSCAFVPFGVAGDPAKPELPRQT